MAVQTWIDTHIFVGGYDLACRAKSFDAPNVTAADLDVTALCDSWQKRIGGLKTSTWTASVMQDFAADQVDQIYGIVNLGGTFPFTVAPAGTSEGSVAYLFNGRNFEYSPLEAAVGDVAMATIAGGGTGPTARGTVMHPYDTARTSSGTTTGVQVGAVPAGSNMYAALHVLSASGTSPTLDVVIESDDNSGFTSDTDRITFTQATGITSEWLDVSGAVTDDYWRVRYTIGGTTPSFTFAVAIGVAAP